MSPEEVARLIDSSRTRFHRLILMALYGTGMRRAELARLQISDIDSRRMVVHIRGEKGRRDRDVMLSPVLLEALRDYWREPKRKPTDCLFPGGNGHTANCPITPKTIYYACGQAAQQAGLQNRVHPHTLRHCFATHEPCDSADRHHSRIFSSFISPGQEPNEVPSLHLAGQPASQTFISLGHQDFVYGFSIGIQPAQELVAFVN